MREPDAPAPFLDREDQDLQLGARGKRLAVVGPSLGAELRVGDEPGLARAEPDERAEVFHALHGAGEHGAHRDARFHLIAGSHVVGRQRQSDAAPGEIDGQDHHVRFGIGGDGLAHRARTAAGNLTDVKEPVDAGQQLDEDPELGGADQPPANDLALAQPAGHALPRIALEGLEAQRDPPLLLVDPQHLHGHRVTHVEPIARPGHANV